MTKLILCEIHGIQNYIYSIVINKLALKRLKGRSKIVDNKLSVYLKKIKKLDENINEIFSGGGKFLIKSELEEKKLNKLKAEFETEVFKEFNGELKLSFIWEEGENLKEIYKKQGKEKLQLFKSIDYKDFINPYGINKREKEKICRGCNKWMGKKYKKNDFNFKDNKNFEDFDLIYQGIICDKCKEEIKIGQEEDNMGFEKLLKINGEKKGYSKLAVLKGDFDNMGNKTANFTIEELTDFSKKIKKYVDNLGYDNKKIIKIYAGGDDFVFIGRWNDIVKFAKEIQGKVKLEGYEEITFSCTIHLFNEKQKIYGVIGKANELLKDAKEISYKKNGLNFLGKSMIYEDYIKLIKLGDKIFEKFNEVVSDGYWYFLLKRAEDRELRNEWNINKIKQGEWLFDYKGKLIYSLSRNYYEKNNEKRKQFASLVNNLFDLKINKFESNIELDIDKFNKQYLKQLIFYILMKKRDAYN